MPAKAAPETYLSLNELGRRANISYPTALKLVANKVIAPDAYQGRTALFKASRWEELRKTIRENVIDYSARDAARFVLDAQHPLNIAANLQA